VYQYATYRTRSHVVVITISRSEVMNALHPPANEELSALWKDLRQTPTSRSPYSPAPVPAPSPLVTTSSIRPSTPTRRRARVSG